MSTNPDTARKAPRRPAASDRVRKTAKAAQQRVTETVGAGVEVLDSSPLSALAGAIAVGAVAAALLPATSQELRTVGPLGDRMREALGEAFSAAKQAGAQHLTASGITATAATSGVGMIVGHLVNAALQASTAAGTTVRKPRDTRASPQNPAPQGS